MATIKNTRENDFDINLADQTITVPGGRTPEGGEFTPGSVDVPDAVLAKAKKNPVIAAWFDAGFLVVDNTPAADKKAAE